MIDCPIDGRRNITTSVCPQCRTDLSPLIYIRELPEKLFLKGTNFLADNQVDDAIKEFINALALEPENVKFILALGKAYLLKGKIDDALKCSSIAITIESTNEESQKIFEECNSLRRKGKMNNRFIRGVLIFIPVVTLLAGLFIKPVLDKISEVKPDLQKINQQVLAEVGKSYAVKELPIKVEFTDSAYILSGSVPSVINKDLAEVILANCLQKDEFTRNTKIINFIAIKPDQLFISYSVQNKDNLTKISRYFLGSASKWEVLLEYNEGLITHPQKLKVGEHIRIPVNEFK